MAMSLHGSTGRLDGQTGRPKRAQSGGHGHHMTQGSRTTRIRGHTRRQFNLAIRLIPNEELHTTGRASLP